MSLASDRRAPGVGSHGLRELHQPVVAVDLAAVIDEHFESRRVVDQEASIQKLVEDPGPFGVLALGLPQLGQELDRPVLRVELHPAPAQDGRPDACWLKPAAKRITLAGKSAGLQSIRRAASRSRDRNRNRSRPGRASQAARRV